jgi:S1-C subfamily serine protease
MMLKAVRGGAGVPVMPLFPDFNRVPDRGRLGIRLERVPAVAADQLGLEPNTGIAVSLVVPNSAAEKAGLKVHDIILEFAGKPVSDNTEDFIRRVGEVKAGEKVDLVVLRKGKKVEVKGVELPEAAKPFRVPQPAAPNLLLPGLLPNLP